MPAKQRMPDIEASPASWHEALVATASFSVFFALYFSPVTLAGGVLAPADRYIFFAPALLSEAHWWNHNLYSGFPAFADPQMLGKLARCGCSAKATTSR